MLKRLLWLMVLAAIGATVSAQGPLRLRRAPAAGGDCTVSLAAGAHPRIWLNTCERTSMISKLTTGPYAAAVEEAIDYVEGDWDDLAVTCSTASVQTTLSCTHFTFTVAAIYEAYDDLDPTYGANLIHTKADYGTKAVALFDRLIAATWVTPENGNLIGPAYDWAYDALVAVSKDDDVRAYADDIDTDADAGCISYGVDPDVNTSTLVNTYFNLCWATQTAFGIAAVNESAWATEQYGWYDEKYFDSTGLINLRNTLTGLTGGDVTEGQSYDTNYSAPADLPLLTMWCSAHNIPRATCFGTSDTDGVKGLAKYFANAYFPWEEDTSTAAFHRPYRAGPGATFDLVPKLVPVFLQGMYEWDTDTAGLFRWIATKTGAPNLTGVQAAKYGFLTALMGPAATPTTRSPSDLSLPLDAYLHNTRFALRENWTDLDAGLIYIEAGKWIRHQVISPQNVCGFAMARDGFNVLFAGTDNNTFGTDGWPGTSNNMQFPNRSSVTPTDDAYFVDYGGRRVSTVAELSDTADLMDTSGWDGLAEERHSYADAANGMAYVGLNCARAYRTEHVTTFWRKYGASVQSDRLQLWVYSRTVTPSTTFVQTDVMQFPANFTVDGTETAGVTPVRKPSPCPSAFSGVQCSTGGSDDLLGHWGYTGATTATLAAYSQNGADGEMKVTVGLPTSRTLVKLGGPDDGAASWNTTGIFSMEGVDLFGVRRPMLNAPTGRLLNYHMPYRLELRAATPAATNNHFYFVELEATASTHSTVTYYLTGTTRDCGLAENASVNIGVCFGKTSESLTSGTFVLVGLQSVTRVFKVCDMSVSTQHVFSLAAGPNITSITVGADSDLTWTSDAGGCLLMSIVFGADGSGTRNTITQSS